MKKIYALVCLILFSSLFLGCGQTRVSQLSEQVDHYNRSLRWSSLKAASRFLNPENKRSLLEQLSKEMKGVKIVDFSIVDLGVGPKKKQGSVIVEFSYYKESQQSLRYRQQLQKWKYASAFNGWVLESSTTLSEK